MKSFPGTCLPLVAELSSTWQDSFLYVSRLRAEIGSRNINADKTFWLGLSSPAGTRTFSLQPGLGKETVLSGFFSGFAPPPLLDSQAQPHKGQIPSAS